MAQKEIQHVLCAWKIASERLALSIPLRGSTDSCRESFFLARQVFHRYSDALMSAFKAISKLPNVECVWKSGLLQYQWRSKSGSKRRLIHATILDYVKERMEADGVFVA